MIPVLENSQDFFRLYQIIVMLDQGDIPEEERRKMMVTREGKSFFKYFLKYLLQLGEKWGKIGS